MPSLTNDDLKTYHRLRGLIEDVLTKSMLPAIARDRAREVLQALADSGVSITLPPERELLAPHELED